jgi:hypothetical protein
VSIPVDLAALSEQIARFGPSALLVTTSPDIRPHISSVLVTIEGESLVMGAGRGTRANAAERRAVTIVWPAESGGDFCLIVDAEAAESPAERLVVRPTSAVLHRVAGAPSVG